LIFPCATDNLQTYWQNTEPVFDEETMRWSLNQMAGLVSGLLDIHECIIRTTTGITPSRRGSSSSIKLKQGEEKFGRHGDIKPENILWFASCPASDDPKGILKIADFGLGRFHGRDTRSNVDWRQIKSSPTYEPPELQLYKPVSRAYDMWSLGCILLEFATWMLKGPKGNEDFADYRKCQDRAFPELSNDEFFTVVDTDCKKAVVRDGVVRWVEQLRQHKNCSAFVNDLLDVIMGHLLVILPAERYGAFKLDKEFQFFCEKAKDPEYLVKPVPTPVYQATTSMLHGTPSGNQGSRPISRSAANTSSLRMRVGTRDSDGGDRRASVGRYPIKSKTWPNPRAS
jgi:serine/threonine protein kinase